MLNDIWKILRQAEIRLKSLEPDKDNVPHHVPKKDNKINNSIKVISKIIKNLLMKHFLKMNLLRVLRVMKLKMDMWVFYKIMT